MTSSSRRAVVVSLALALAAVVELAPERGARAQPSAGSATPQELETARALYKEGKDLRREGNLRGALEKLQAAHALGNTPVTGIELARTYVMVGQIVEAREVCLYIARVPVASDETEKSVEARSEAAKLAEELRPRIPTLRVKVEGLSAGETAHLSIDGAGVPDAAFGEPQKVDPGKHAVAIRTGDGATAREVRGETEVSEGQAAEVTLTVTPAPRPLAPEPLPPPAHPRRSGLLLVKLGFGAAGAGAAVGILAGLAAMSKASQLPGECPAKQCDNTYGGANDLAAARAWATVSTVAFAVGGAGAVAGIIGLVTGKSESARHDEAGISPWIGTGAAGIRGRF